MEKYIVAYNSSEANVRRVKDDEKYCRSEMMDMYKFALNRHLNNFGEIVAWNNQFWCVIEADNAMDALVKFFEKKGA